MCNIEIYREAQRQPYIVKYIQMIAVIYVQLYTTVTISLGILLLAKENQ